MDSWLRSGTRNLNWVIATLALECALLVSMLHAQGIFRHVGMDFLTTYTAAEMLAMLTARLGNDPTHELQIAAAEQAKITALRLV